MSSIGGPPQAIRALGAHHSRAHPSAGRAQSASQPWLYWFGCERGRTRRQPRNERGLPPRRACCAAPSPSTPSQQPVALSSSICLPWIDQSVRGGLDLRVWVPLQHEKMAVPAGAGYAPLPSGRTAGPTLTAAAPRPGPPLPGHSSTRRHLQPDHTNVPIPSDREHAATQRLLWHARQEGRCVLEAMGSNADGLSQDEAAWRLRHHGPNVISARRADPWYRHASLQQRRSPKGMGWPRPPSTAENSYALFPFIPAGFCGQPCGTPSTPSCWPWPPPRWPRGTQPRRPSCS